MRSLHLDSLPFRLMEHYDLRSCFLPNLAGLHLRIYQFQHLLSQHLPELTEHLDKLKVEPLYLSQWFLSFFGVTCPLPMLIRIYDVILTEGASETLMRVALSLMRRNEKKILAATEFEDIMQLLLSRGLWDTYSCDADELVNDFVSWTGLVTREGLQSLEASFKENQQSTITSRPSIHTAASRFLGRFWAGSGNSPKTAAAPTLSMPVRHNGQMQRSPSKQSMASTLNSIESSEGHQSTASTVATSISQDLSIEDMTSKQTLSILSNRSTSNNKDKDLHSQIEDLLIALCNLQREHSTLSNELQKEREEREEDRAVVHRALDSIKQGTRESAAGQEDKEMESTAPNMTTAIMELETQFLQSGKRSSLALQTKHQLREEVSRWKSMYNEESLRMAELTRRLTEREHETAVFKEQLRDARARIADAHRDKQRLEKTNQELKARKSTQSEFACESPTSPEIAMSPSALPTKGLRELKLGRGSVTSLTTPQPAFSKRVSSLITKDVLSTEDHRPPTEDALLHELVNAKTAEAVARQELEEVKAKLDSLRKLMSGSAASGNAASHTHNSSIASNKPPTPPLSFAGIRTSESKDKAPTPSSSYGSGFFSGWGKRSASGFS